MIRSITRKLAESREVLGLRGFVGEVIGVPVAVVAVWAIAFGTAALVSDGAPSGLHPTGFDQTIAGENHDR